MAARSGIVLMVALAACPPEVLPAQAGASADTTSRTQLARLLLGFEYALRDHPPADAARAGLSRAFDAATLAFFGGRTDAARRTLDSLAAVVEPDSARRAEYARAADRALARAASDRRTLRTPTGAEIPYRVRVPSGRAHPRALLVALHGAGGDERMWFESYGAGALVPLADARDLVVVTPLTTAMRDHATLDAIVEAVAAETPIDRRRVLLLGHSLGAGTAWRLTGQRGAMLAGVACLAGPCGVVAAGDSAVRPPLFAAAGALDPLAAPARVEAAARAASVAGRIVEYRLVPDQGHTLMVPAILPAALDWLVARAPSAREYRAEP
ncbi:MAG: alpha/beta fold hydrolase [Gemmatimonadaceae bacterium]|nr:alpha/beta fold hydrolase [Gemmatimonadaceae bacterium]